MNKKQKEALVLALLEKGETYRDIARKAGVAHNTIKAISNRAGLDETTSISSRAFELYDQSPLLIPALPRLPFIQTASNQEIESVVDRRAHTKTNAVPYIENGMELDLPILRCNVCHEYNTAIEFDMALHIMELHNNQLHTHIYRAEGIELYPEFNDRVDYAIDMANGIIRSRTYSRCILQ